MLMLLRTSFISKEVLWTNCNSIADGKPYVIYFHWKISFTFVFIFYLYVRIRDKHENAMSKFDFILQERKIQSREISIRLIKGFIQITSNNKHGKVYYRCCHCYRWLKFFLIFIEKR